MVDKKEEPEGPSFIVLLNTLYPDALNFLSFEPFFTFIIHNLRVK